MKPKKILGISLPDIQIKDPSCLKNKLAHLDVVNDNLVITIDFDSGQFAIATGLQLQGLRIDNALKVSKKILEQEAKIARLKLENLK